MNEKRKEIIFKNYLKLSNTQPIINFSKDKTEIIVVIPAYNEPELFSYLKNLTKAYNPNAKVDVIVVLNYKKGESSEIIKLHEKIEKEFTDWSKKNSTNWLNFYCISLKDLPKKKAGVGFARKIGFDQAILRFYELKKYDGIIASLDADCLIDENYFIELKKHFDTYKKTMLFNIRFEHLLNSENFALNEAMAMYECYLHYYSLALKYINFPYYYHTIGSCFALRAYSYCLVDGFTSKQGGEDFYFLHKLFPFGKIGFINTTTVRPSSRLSTRVPFGTGPSLIKILNSPNKKLYIYSLSAFECLKDFFYLIEKYYFLKDKSVFNKLHPLLLSFLEENKFFEKLNEIETNTSNFYNFKKRFFQWFNALKILKALNKLYSIYSGFIIDELNLLLERYNKKIDIDKQMTAVEYLLKLRKIIFQLLYKSSNNSVF